MKRNLFKKLSFIMALALVVTAMAPAAAPAKAAANPSLNATSKTLYVGKSYNFNVKNKVKKSKYAWTSSDKKVATVNAKNGVAKAVAPGKATISCKVTLPTNKTKTLKATVTVKQDASAVAIKNPVSEVKVGDATYQFKRTITPKASTNKTFYVIDKESNTAGAVAVNDKGVINVANAGEFKIKAVAARGRAQFNAGTWRAESEWLTVKVPVEMTAKLTAANKIELTSNGEFGDDVVTSDVIVREKETQVRQSIKAIETTGKVANIELYNSMSDGKTYTITTGDVTTEVTAVIGKIASIVLQDKTIGLDGSVFTGSISYNVFDENGLDITAMSDYSTLSKFDVSYSAGTLDKSNNKITLYSEGDFTLIQLKYIAYTTEGKDASITSNQAKYTAAKSVPAKISKWYVDNRDPNAYSWNNNHNVKAEDYGYFIFVEFNNSSGNTEKTSETSPTKAGYDNLTGTMTAEMQNGLQFESLDTDILAVDYHTGQLYPYKEGNATVKVTSKNEDKFVEHITVTVQAKRTISKLEVSTNSFKLSNLASVDDTKEVAITLKDQYGDRFITESKSVEFDVISGKAEIIQLPGNGTTDISLGGLNTNTLKKASYLANFKAVSDKEGTVSVRVKVGDYAQVITITVAKPGAGTDYAFELDSTELNNYNEYPNLPTTTNLTFSVYETDGSKVKRSVVSDGGTTYANDGTTWVATYKVKKSDGSVVKLDGTNENYSLEEKININALALQLDVGTYTIEVTLKQNKNGTISTGTVRQQTFTVVSDKPTTSSTAKKVSITAGIGTSIETIVNDCLDIKLGGSVIEFISSYTGDKGKVIDYIKFTSYDSGKMIGNMSDASGAGVGSTITSGSTDDTFRIRITEIGFKEYKFDGGSIKGTPVKHKVNPNVDITITIQ